MKETRKTVSEMEMVFYIIPTVFVMRDNFEMVLGMDMEY
jgi:hypothetical protein